MNTLKKFGAVFATGLATSMAFMGHVLAAPPVMDTSIQDGILDVVTGLKDTIFANILAVLPVAGIVLVTLVGIRWLFGTFHRVARA